MGQCEYCGAVTDRDWKTTCVECRVAESDARQAAREALRSQRVTIERDHGVADVRGRAVGGLAHIVPGFEVDYSSAGTWEWRQRPVWRLVVRATRAGVEFGAYPRETEHASLEEARKVAERKLAAQGARYRRNPPR